MTRIGRPGMLLAASLATALGLSGCEQVEDKAFEFRLRAYIREHPEVVREAAQKLREKRTLATRQSLQSARQQLEHDPRDFVANPGGHVTVVQFFDNKCVYCSNAAPQVMAMIAGNRDVRFVFKQYPIFGSTSDYAAAVSLTPAGKARGLDLYRAFLGQQNLTTARVDALAARAGLGAADLELARTDPSIRAQIDETRALAQAIGVRGAPAFVVGNRIIQGADMEALDSAISQARSRSFSVMGEALSTPPPAKYPAP